MNSIAMANKTICLTMIVKNEAHLILECFRHLEKYIRFDYWVINDNGSTDGTQKLIKEYFAEKGIPGELDETPWQDFAFNRTVAFKRAFEKTDYAFVWDADDEIYGDFKLPTILDQDHYKFIFGNEQGARYSRCQLFNNKKRWHYVGVIHEYPAALEPVSSPFDVLGNYYFISGRRGARNNDPNKYLKDALVLEKAFKEAFEKKEPIYNRYCFYTAQSYNSCNHHEKAIEYYKKVLEIDNWIQEKYVSCIEIYDQYDKLKRNQEGLFYLLESFKYDRKRIEGIYRLIKYYCINGPVEAAYAYYTMIAEHYENDFIKENVSDYLFTKKDEYDFYLPYYMVIVSQRVGKLDTSIKMLEMIFRQGYLHSGEWWIHNLFHNIQFAIPKMPTDLAFLENMLKYIEALKRRGVSLNENNNKIVDSIIAHYRPLLVAEVPSHYALMPKKFNGHNGNNGNNGNKVKVMFTITTCKRFDLFEQTINSILKNWLDIDKIDYFFCVDDNSSKEDRLKMQTQYPFFNYHMKSANEKGHRESMNVIWKKVNELNPDYLIHMEDDWLFFKKENYVGRAIAALEKYEGQEIHQVVFNREYGLMMFDMQRVNVVPLGPKEEGLCLHIKKEGVQGPNCAYWPHYSLQPSVCRASKILELGDYTSPNQFFERDYADRYHAKGYQTAFFDFIYSLHIGKQSWEKEGHNAYSLNQVGQFKSKVESQDTTIEITVRENNEPLQGTMAQHLEKILKKIESRVPFGLIRPSDGEYKILKNETLTNLDEWTFKQGGKLRGQLAEAIQTKDPNLYIGIPCNTCNKPWNCTDQIYNEFLRFGVPLAQRTYANLVGNSNWQRFSEFMKTYEPGFYLITSGQDSTQLPIKELYTIDSKLVDKWDTVGEEETARLLRFIKGKKGLFCFSAGPLSKIWIPMCMKLEPTNMYMDVGASLDIFTKGNTNRLYTNTAHPFSKEQCIFRDSIPDVSLSTVIPSFVPLAPLTPLKAKNLVYLGVFVNKDYLELLKALVISVKLFSLRALDSVDFLIMTSRNFAADVQKISEDVGVPLNLMFLDTSRLKGAAFARLYIFEYEHIMSYEKILYLDTDIIVQGDLMNVFEEPLEDNLYAMKEGTIEHEIHGGWWFDFATINKNTVGINSGILLFKATEAMKAIFTETIAHIDELRAAKKPMPSCEDQAFINYHFIKSTKYNNTLMEKYGLIYCIDPPPPPSAPTPVVICHFVWPIGNAQHKLGRMKPHLTHVLKNYASIFNETEYGPILLGTSYTWNSSGWIRFEANGLLETKWCQGTYEWVGTHSLYATWAGLTHFLRFNDDYSGFISIRLGDLDFINGTRINNKISIILTSTVNVNTKDSYFLTDSSERLNQYIKSVRLWLENTKYNIVLVENSGYAFQELSEEREKYCERFEILSLKGMDEAPEVIVALKDKGLHELFSINYALNNSRLIHKSKFVIKVTGRYYIPGFEAYTNTFNLDLYDCIVQNGYLSNSRCEMFGCQLKHSRDVFSLTLEPEYLTYPYNVVESIYKKRIEKCKRLLECKVFPIEATICCGNNRVYRHI